MLRRGDRGVYVRRPGAVSYGQPWGTIMLDFDSPFVPGDMGNASSYDAPVLFRKVPRLSVGAILADSGATFEKAVIEAAQALVEAGATAITSNCGFMIRYQDAVADALGGVTVALSSLLQLPFIARTIPPSASIAIITADAGTLDAGFIESQFFGLGHRVRIGGLQDSPHFRQAMFEGSDELDADGIREEVLDAVRRLRADDSRLNTILLECAALPAYANALQDEWPDTAVYDFWTLTRTVMSARERAPFHGWY